MVYIYRGSRGISLHGIEEVEILLHAWYNYYRGIYHWYIYRERYIAEIYITAWYIEEAEILLVYIDCMV